MTKEDYSRSVLKLIEIIQVGSRSSTETQTDGKDFSQYEKCRKESRKLFKLHETPEKYGKTKEAAF